MLFTRTIRNGNVEAGMGWGMHVHVCDFCRFVCVHIDIAK